MVMLCVLNDFGLVGSMSSRVWDYKPVNAMFCQWDGTFPEYQFWRDPTPLLYQG